MCVCVCVCVYVCGVVYVYKVYVYVCLHICVLACVCMAACNHFCFIQSSPLYRIPFCVIITFIFTIVGYRVIISE